MWTTIFVFITSEKKGDAPFDPAHTTYSTSIIEAHNDVLRLYLYDS